MSLCCSLTGEDILDDLSLDDLGKNDKSQVSEPHNSTLIEEDCHLELKDIIPQDLSAIMGRQLLKGKVYLRYSSSMKQSGVLLFLLDQAW